MCQLNRLLPSTERSFLDRDKARQILNLSKEDFIFSTLGRLAKEKDHKTLIEGFSLIKSEYPHAKLVILGDGVLKSELKKQINELNMANDIIMLGFIPEAFRLMKAFDVFVLSSIQESFGRVLLEAMVAKLPIIATKVEGIPEVIENNDYLIEPQNPLQLAHALRSLYDMTLEKRQAQGEKGYKRVVKEFSIPRFKEIFWEHLHKNYYSGS
jgi:glycosyltransferase involved in cell wall biosynthesis